MILVCACAVLATAAGCTPEQWQQVCEQVAPQERVQASDACRWLPDIAELWPVEEWGNALAIIACESKGDPRVQYGGRDSTDWKRATGLFQIKPGNLWGLAPFKPGGSGEHLVDSSLDWAGKIEWLKDPANNMAAAYAIWFDGYGDPGWHTRSSGERRSWRGGAKWDCARTLRLP